MVSVLKLKSCGIIEGMSMTDTIKTAALLQVRLWTCGLLWEPRKLRNKLPRRRSAIVMGLRTLHYYGA
jgi:hypothetical protein